MLSTESQQYGEQIYKVSGKLKRHIQLAIYQKEFIEERLEKANQLANDIEKKAKKIDRQAENLLQNVYSSFIAILGIFSAITKTDINDAGSRSTCCMKYNSDNNWDTH